ncbi:MAG TPA: N-methyl-L-tryptophan oxidase, partial [Cyclobacteriaceae bacterium]|nr:N-methyl-L-tryptophan oxidase [Cyclobacteriaceae bacterium]
AIVLGVGSMGSSTCYYLASRGYRVLGLEQFDIPHDHGSHAGQSRIIRKAYFEHPDYVPLLERAYENWKEIEGNTDSQIYFPTGLLYAGKPEEVLIKGVRESAEKYKLNVESLSKSDTKHRFPQFQIPEGYEVLFEPDAGFVTPERAILLFAEQAIRKSAQIHTKEKTTSWKKEGDLITVITDKSTYTCKKLIITAGAWAGSVIPGFSSQLKVTRQVIAWVNPKERKPFELGQFPCWMIDDHTQQGMYYGFPVLPVAKFGAPIGLKVALHHPGLVSNPDAVNRIPSKEDENHLVEALDKYLPQGYETTHVLKTCLYTNTPDENFILDFLPGYDQQVAIAAGFSGHGFKFVSVVGEIMADLSMKGKTHLPIDFLNAKRFK